MGIGISPTWTFKEVVKNIKAIRLRYEEVLLSFSVYELRNEIEFRREARNSVYALNMQEWKKDRIWDYMNDFLDFGVLEQICKREQRNGNKR